jgi:hypothetical protein
VQEGNNAMLDRIAMLVDHLAKYRKKRMTSVTLTLLVC